MYSINRPTPPSISRPARFAAGVTCLCLGVVGLALPLIPGIPLLIVGGLLLRNPRRRSGDPTARTAPRARGRLSALEQLQLRVWLLARRITTRAESLRLARRARQRGY
jgi:hypothetical protein